VADGRKMPVAKVRAAARGRVWSGADAKDQGLVDILGGFWTAAGQAASLAGLPADGMTFRVYPRPTGLWARLEQLSGGMDASLGANLSALGRIESVLNLPAVQALLGEVSSLPQGGPGSTMQLKAAHLPRP
jgi:ClpP class serine protease